MVLKQDAGAYQRALASQANFKRQKTEKEVEPVKPAASSV